MTDVWLDLANAADVPFFAPVVEALGGHDVTVTITARDFGATLTLAHRAFPDVVPIGAWGRSMPAKGAALARRAMACARFARGRGFRLALGLNSYAQVMAARALRVPVLTTMDYEGQPANHLAFRLARRVLVPACFPPADLERYGARAVATYPGLKEEAYLAREIPEMDVRAHLGAGERPLVLLRPPPDSATYHQFDNPLFEQAVDCVLNAGDALAVLLPRTEAQAAWAAQRWDGNVAVQTEVLPNVALLWAADLVVGAGGTMNREAALLGTPTYSLFAGRPSAVDRELVERGLLTPLGTEGDLARIAVRRKDVVPWPPPSAGGDDVLQAIVACVLEELERR